MDSSAPMSPATSEFSLQSSSFDKLDQVARDSQTSSPSHKSNNRLTEVELNAQLLNKLDSVTSNPIYSESDRQRILNYVSSAVFCALRQIDQVLNVLFPHALVSLLRVGCTNKECL
jgi:hypothetical protein